MTYRRFDIATPPVGVQPVASRAAEPPARTNLFWARAIFIMFVTGVILRVFFTDAIVNLFWPYTAEGGMFPAKIHPGSYLIFASAGLLYFTPGYRFAPADLPVLRAFILFFAGSGLAAIVPMMQGRNGPAGYVIDVYFVICSACIFLLAMPQSWRQLTGLIVLGFLAANTMITIAEFATGRYLIPTVAAEFRPTGLLGAALNVGVIHLTACVLVVSLPLHWTWKYGLASLLMLGLLISGSRTAMLLSLIVIPVSVLISARLRNSGVSVGVTAISMLVLAATLAPLLFFLIFELGFLDRFKGGYVDDSAQTRIEIYRVFEFVSWREVAFGTDILRIRKIAQELLGIELIESAIVFFVFDFGLLCLMIFAPLLLWLIWRIAWHSHPAIGLALAVFLVLALTNNTLSTKVPSTFFAFVLAISLRAFHDGRRRV